MPGRKKHPNSPNATHAIRLTERAFQKLKSMQQGDEPYGWTLERALDIGKKVRAHENLNRELKARVLHLTNVNKKLIKIQHKQAEQISLYEEMPNVQKSK